MTKPMNRAQRDRAQKAWTRAFKNRGSLAGLISGVALLCPVPAALAAGEIQILTEFSPVTISQGDGSTLRLTIQNNVPNPLTNTQLNQTLPAGLSLNTAAGVISNSCNLTVSLASATTLVVNGGTLPAFTAGIPGECVLEVPVIGGKAPNSNIALTIPVDGFQAGGFGNSSASTGNIRVNQFSDLTSTLAFSPTVIPGGGVTKFRFNLSNGTNRVLTGANFTNGFNLNLPAGFTLRSGTLNNTCGGTVDLSNFPNNVKLQGGVIPIAGCFFEFELDGPTVEVNFGPVSWAAGDLVTDLQVSNQAATSNGGTVETGMRISQGFNRGNVFINEASTLTITIRNAGAAVSGGTLTSLISTANGNLAALALSGVNGGIDTTCPTLPGVSYNGAGQLQFTNVSVPAASSGPSPAAAVAECRIRVRLITDKDGIGTYTSTIANGQLRADQRIANNTSLVVSDLVGDGGNGVGFDFGFGPIGGGFSSYEVAAGNRGRLRITLRNDAGEALTGVAVGGSGIALDAGMSLADTGVFNNTCTANAADIIANANATAITLSNAAIPRRGTCSFEVNVVSNQFNVAPGYGVGVAAGVVSTNPVTGQAGRTYTNAAWNSGTNQGRYLEVTDFLNIIPSMATAVVAPNADARIQLRLTNSELAAKSQLRLRYRLPFGIAPTPDFFAGASCGISPTAFTVVELTPGVFELQADDLQIPGRAATGPSDVGNSQDGTCDIAFDVTAPGTPQNDVPVLVQPGTLSSADGSQQNRTNRTTQFNVQALLLNLQQTIINEEIDGPPEAANRVRGGEPVVLTVRLTNPAGNGVPLTNINFSDVLEDPTALIVPGGIPTTTCTGATPAVNEATKGFSLSGATLAPGASCELRVPITTLSVELLTNRIEPNAAIAQEGAKNTDQEDAQIFVSANLALVKAFEPDTINTDGISRLTLTVLNATTAGYSDLVLTDNLPEGVTLASNPNLVSTCGPASAPGGGDRIGLTGGSVPVAATCTIAVDVTSLTANAAGYENIVPAGGVTALGGAITTIKDASARLFVNGVSIERPNLHLVKRITEVKLPARPGFAEQTVAIASVHNFTPASGPDTDNAPGWPAPSDPSGISSYLKGAYNTSQIPGGQSELLTSGMEIEYTGYYLSNGTGSAENTGLCDFIPANTTYIPGSLQWIRGDGTTTPIADAPSSGSGFFAGESALPNACQGTNNGRGAVAVDLGSVPRSTGAGAPANSYGRIVFRVKVD